MDRANIIFFNWKNLLFLLSMSVGLSGLSLHAMEQPTTTYDHKMGIFSYTDPDTGIKYWYKTKEKQNSYINKHGQLESTYGEYDTNTGDYYYIDPYTAVHYLYTKKGEKYFLDDKNRWVFVVPEKKKEIKQQPQQQQPVGNYFTQVDPNTRITWNYYVDSQGTTYYQDQQTGQWLPVQQYKQPQQYVEQKPQPQYPSVFEEDEPVSSMSSSQQQPTEFDAFDSDDDYSALEYQFASVDLGEKVGKTIPRSKFVSDLIGMAEENFRQKYGWHNGVLTKIPTDQKAFDKWKSQWIAEDKRRAAVFQGKFNFYSVADLDKQVATAGPLGTPRFRVKIFNPNDPKLTDVIYMQSQPQYKNAVFQLASTFFGPLEGGIVDYKASLEDMLKHAVQGEDASIGAAGATFWRKYIMPTLNDAAGKTRYYYLLYYLRNKLPMHGHQSIDTNKVLSYQYSPNDVKNVGVGVHKDVVAVYGYGSNGSLEQLPIYVNADGTVNTQKTQIVNQVFTSAYSTIHVRKKNQMNKNVEDLCKMLLDASYEATIKAARGLNQPKVVLTLVGGGAFRNEIAWIGEAIERVKGLIQQYGLDVELVYRPDKPGRSNPVRTAEKDITFLEKMLKISDEINHTQQTNDQQFITRLKNYVQSAYAMDKNNDQSVKTFKHAAANLLGK